MLMASEEPIIRIAAIQTISLRVSLFYLGNPMLFHLIYSGSGALLILTLLIGNSLSLKTLQNFSIETGTFCFSICSLAFEFLRVTKTMLWSYNSIYSSLELSNFSAKNLLYYS